MPSEQGPRPAEQPDRGAQQQPDRRADHGVREPPSPPPPATPGEPPDLGTAATPPPPAPAPVVRSATTPPAAATTAAPVEPPRRLHPFSVVRGLQVRGLVGTVTGLFVIGNDLPGPVVVGVLLAGLVVTAVVRVLGWQRHTYELTGERVVERSGIVRRDERALELARIQQVDVHRGILDRLVGTAELRLETAADSGDSEIRLAVVTVAEADRLRERLDAAAGAAPPRPAAAPPGGAAGSPPGLPASAGRDEWAPPTAAPSEQPREQGGAGRDVLVQVPLTHVALAAVTGRRLLLLPAGLAFLFGFVDDLGLFDDVEERVGSASVQLGVLGAIGIALAVAAVGVAAAVVGAVLRDGNWTLTATDVAFRVQRGLTDQRTATVPRRRVQAVSVQRSWLRGLLGFATVTVRSAGGGKAESGAAAQLDQQLTVPLLPEADVAPLVRRLLGVDPDEEPPLRQHPPAARRRAVVVGLLAASGPALGCAVVAAQSLLLADSATRLAGLRVPDLAVPFGVAAVVVLLLGAGSGLLRHHRRATGIGDALLVSRTGMLGTTTVHVPRRKVQGTATSSTPFQRRRQLGTLDVHVAGPSGGVHVLDLDAADAERIRRDLVRRAPSAATDGRA